MIVRFFYNKIRDALYFLTRAHNLHCFLKKVKRGGKLLDVGCGNNSPYKIKSLRPDIEYIGLDVGDYNQTKPNLADKYIIVPPKKFAQKIAEFENEFDAIISSHNLEHCDDRNAVLDAMTKALKIDGGGVYCICLFQRNAA